MKATLARVARILVGLVALDLALVLLLRFVPPPTTMFMLTADLRPVHYQWTDWNHIAAVVPLAAVAAEDQKFPEHWGFDVAAIENAMGHNEHSRHVHGASTITQQTAKNLFLWRARSYLRKALEAGFTVCLETLWSKRRILEVYLNVAQFGPDIYGVEAASHRYFGKSAAQLNLHEAALLAAVLPNPVRYRLDRPSPYVQGRAADIEQQMRQLGSAYLRNLR